MSTKTQPSKVCLAYIECALWSSVGDEPLDADYGIDDIAPETLARMQVDCDDFTGNPEVAALLEQSRLSAEQIGYDFWLTRNGHGAGFWDRGLGDVGTKLTAMTKPYGGCDLYVGDDDGKIYC